MQLRYQANLAAKLQANAANYLLPDTTFKSFHLQNGFSRARDLSAADAVYAVTALLEAGGRVGAEVPPHERFWYETWPPAHCNLRHSKRLKVEVKLDASDFVMV